MKTNAVVIAVWLCVSAPAAEMPKPSVFGRADLEAPADAVVEAWARWEKVSRDFEREAMASPRSEGRDRVRGAYAASMDYLEARRIYSEAVRSDLESRARGMAITSSAVSSEELDLLGAQVSEIQRRLETLRSTTEWITIRHSVQKDRDAIGKLQDTRRAMIPDGLLSTRAGVAETITAASYQASEQEVRGAIRSLWTHYCQALLNLIYQQPEGSMSPEVQLEGSEPAGVESAQKGGMRLAGAWTYIENSRKFEGAAEPKRVLLELWVENGQLAGRYRADLLEQTGLRHVDLRLKGKPSARHAQSLEFSTADSRATGTVTLQPSSNGMELMFIRPSGVAEVPGGKELLTRR